MSSLYVLRVLERVHGHAAWLAVAALAHPAILLRKPGRSAKVAALVSTLLVTFTAALGAWIYPEYRARLRASIFLEEPTLGWMFERKEHLAIGVVGLAWTGWLSNWVAPRCRDERLRRIMSTAAHRSYVAAFALAVTVALLGVSVAAFRTF